MKSYASRVAGKLLTLHVGDKRFRVTLRFPQEALAVAAALQIRGCGVQFHDEETLDVDCTNLVKLL